MADSLYPAFEPYAEGKLDVGDGNHIHWETSGNPEGKPAVFVHGGPGSGTNPQRRRYFDPARYRLICFDQRGCGRSIPHASDPATDLRHNTTEHLLGDLERLREHLGVERWLLFGGSWGSTLQLAYAQRHPERVSEIVIAGVTTSSRREIDWLYHGAGRFLPAEWERFRDAAAEAGHDGDLLSAYARLLDDPDPEVRIRATDAWCAWEDALLDTEPNGTPGAFRSLPLTDRLAMVRLCAHYFSHGAWLDEGALLRDAARLSGIPGVLIHGKLDLSCPLDTAWLLARAWPDAELVVIDDAGHTGSAAMRTRIRQALDTFAARP
ncbi:prolyl aminopeptidase [Prauserella sp. PE36]|uniref:Proline iminopeptidase n=1 Tax=Prauserella endophytica TaxID=1592324 RepID=A0ABY2SAT2_9PSEU|nr:MULTISPECIES: prolyl aminopeptidase [Prauserella]RBM21112.1 prolyl aminopeptidase [Prauserella sp. PE36]TKG72105.1 prolyl aminopeptidase [Prauserella endophytica]